MATSPANPSYPPDPGQAPPQQEAGQTVMERKGEWCGPLPPLVVLHQFNHSVPNGAEGIFAQFEQQRAHRREMERETRRMQVGHLEGERREKQRGQWMAASFAFAALAVAALALVLGYPRAAMVIGGATIAMVVSAFLLNKVLKPKDEE